MGALFLGTAYLTGVNKQLAVFFTPSEPGPVSPPATVAPPAGNAVNDVSGLVTSALYFKSLLTTTQQNTLQQTYTTALARKWSNLPCGSGCRNGIQFATLTSAQLGAALDVVKAALSTGYTHQGANEFYQLRLADWVLSHQYSGGSGYDSTVYFMAFLNTPSTTGQWMLQFGGHHFAANIAFNGGKVVGPTPQFRGVEPTSFTVGATTYTPLSEERAAMQAMLASFSSTELATAKNPSTYSDCLLSPGESNGNTNTFPATKAGIAVSTLNAAKQALVLAAMEPYINDLDDASAATLRTQYAKEINSTYVTWTGSGTSGTAGTFLNANTNYVRIDGPSVWIEFICQTGVVINTQIHYHTVWRDHVRDYGADLTLTALPVNIAGFGVNVQGGRRLVNWKTADESAIDHYEVERSTNVSAGFVSVGQVAARNTASGNYSFTDDGVVAAKIIYYRLKIVDKTGDGRYSDVVTAKLNQSQSSITVYPNPAKDNVNVLLASDASNASVTIVNGSGATVYARKGQSGTRLTVAVSKFATGTYVVRVEEGGETATASFLKKN